MNLFDDVKNSRILLVITSRGKARNNLIRALSVVQKCGNRIGYICISDTIEKVIEDLKKSRINIDKFYFVDTLSYSLKLQPETDNCIFVSSPSSLTEIRVGPISLFQEKNRDIIFLDNVTDLAKYADFYSLIKFFHELITKTHSFAGKLILLAYKGESMELVKDISMFADRISVL